MRSKNYARRYRISVWMQVGDELFNKREIYRLYFRLSESLSSAPTRQHETDGGSAEHRPSF